MTKVLGFVIAAVVVGLAAYMFYFQRNNPKKVIAYGRVVSKSHYSPYKDVEVRTRRVQQAHLDYWEVEISKDMWIDCAGDCGEAYRISKSDFWEHQQLEEK